METELKECRYMIKKRKTPNPKKPVEWEELERAHWLKQVCLLEVNDMQHGHITRASDKDGVSKMHVLWQSQSEGRLPTNLQRSTHDE